MGVSAEDLITYSVYYENIGKLLVSRVEQVIEEAEGKEREYLENVRGLLQVYGKKLTSVAWAEKKKSE